MSLPHPHETAMCALPSHAIGNRRQCFCYNQFDVKNCSVQGIYSTNDVLTHDEPSLRCPQLIRNWQMDLRSKDGTRTRSAV